MAEGPDPPDWIVERPGLTLLAVVSSLLAGLIFLPYLQFVLLGVVLAYILTPLQRRLEGYLGPTPAALALVIGTLLVVLLPLMYVLAVATRQLILLVQDLTEGGFDAASVTEALPTEQLSVDVQQLYQSFQSPIQSGLQGVAGGAVSVLGGLPGLFIGLTITLFVLFALLRDGDRFVDWIEWVVPIEDHVLADLRDGLDSLMWASVVANVAVAAVQAVLLGIGLFVAGVPAVILLTVVTFVLTLLPLVGAFGVWVPAAIYLLVMNRPTAALAMVVYGLFVTFSDSYFRPAMVGRTGAFNSTIAMVGIFGGLVVFGAVGLFIGPVVLGGAKLVLDAFARERSDNPNRMRS